MSTSQFSAKAFSKMADDDLSSELSVNVKKTIYSDPISSKNQIAPKRIGGVPSKSHLDDERRKVEAPRVRGGKFNVMNAFDRHKQLVNNYLTYYGKGARNLFKPDKTKWKKDIDLARENHRFLWEDEEGEEISLKDLQWEQRIAKKYWDKLFKEYAICDLTFYKKNRVAFRWRTEKEVISGKGQFECAQKKICSEKDGLRTWEVNFGYVEENIKKFALVKVRLCATCSAKLNSNKKYREVRKEQNRLALLREKEERLDQKREKANYEKRKRKLSEEKSKNPDEPKKKLTDREQKEKIKMDEADLGSTKESEDIWEKPAAVDEEKTKEQEFDEYFEDLFM